MHLIYVAEAHPSDEWQIEDNERDGVIFAQPTCYEDRERIAHQMLAELEFDLPTLVDGMDDAAATAFAAWPERLFVIDTAGKIAFAGEPGPFGFVPEAAREVLEALLS